jgi:small RNA 2'-O-methyltransferase
MAIVQIKTEDENLGFIIRKNPASGMQIKSIRQGTAFGWYSQNNTAFNILFKDADNAVSFGDQQFEYLNTTRYNSPLFVINAISEFFSSTVKEQIDMDKEGTDKSFLINMIDVKYIMQLRHFEKYFEDFTIEYDPYVAKSYKVNITTKKSFHELFNYVNLMMIFLSLSSDEYIHIDQSSIEKYLSSIERLDAPFFIRYLFSRNLIRSKNQFSKFRNRLQTSDRYESIEMDYGNTAMQRRNSIRKQLMFDKSIIDIGCGEGFYAIPFAKNLNDDITYHAIDIVSELTETVLKKASNKDVNNIAIYNHIDEYVETHQQDQSPVDVILTEVIEHMPIEDSKTLMQTVIDKINFDKFIVTVPNKDFNQFYMIEDPDFRHLDHDWEPTQREFEQLMTDMIPSNFKLEFIDIGDTVNGISTSIGCIITNIKDVD